MLKQLVLATALVGVSLTLTAGQGKGGGGSTPPPKPEILFVDSGIKVMNADGTNVRSVVSLGRGEYAEFPNWGPTGNALAFGGNLGGQGEGVYTVNLDGSNRRKVVSTTGFAFPKWSSRPGPNGIELIAYTDYGPAGITGAKRDVFVVNPDGTGKLNVTNSPDSFESYCAWSRDGSRLYFTRDMDLLAVQLGRDASGDLYVVSEDVVWSESTQFLIQIEAANTEDKLVFLSTSNGVGRLHILDLEVSPPAIRLVTAASTGDERFPCFSPDDSRIVFLRNGSAGGGIFTVGQDGTNEVRIRASGKGFAPHWKRPAQVVP
ncbi:MAG: PD40 domain-containing protein [Methanoregulaceae archaeon]|nr:PD40 domain-containing protein [Methanoregulaceae archaeon]